MAKKKTKRRRKRQPPKANPKRQAHAQLKGYYYQILHSVDAWLDLADDESLYLEGVEDFDKVSDDGVTATQVKHTQRNITLKSEAAIDAINHYWELKTKNTNRKAKFRFLTRSQIGIERGNPFGKGLSGLDIWSRCSGDKAAITKISEFLQGETKISKEIADFLEKAEPEQIYEQLIEPIIWETGSKGASFVEESIKAKLIYHGDRYCITPPDAQKVFDSLITEAFRIATQKENRKLTKKHFLKIFAENTRVSVPIQNIHGQQPIALQVVLNHIKEALIADSSDITIQSQSPIQDTIPPIYHDVVLRTDLLASIQSTLYSQGIAVIQGGTGRGKTILAKLTANDINSSWRWLSLTDKDPTQVVQFLQQLAIEVSSQSSQINVVLDDLDLRHKELRKYEEVLGVVFYRVLERGAKVLITGQHKLPDYFSRVLGIPSSVVIQVPNFTISEIEKFAQQLGCPANHIELWARLTQLHTSGHPRLVHAQLAQLRGKGWKHDEDENIFQTPREVIKEREEARQLLINLPEDQRKFLYRLSLMTTEFRKDCALNISEIPIPISYPGDIFTQLVGPWIDSVGETYYRISPLLNKAAEQVWSKNKINNLHAQIADAILKAEDLTTTEARAILLHSMSGQNKEGVITVIHAFITAAEDDWEEISKEFSWLMHVKTSPPEELFPGDIFVNYMFRLLQYRIAVQVQPERAPKLLEIWEAETKPHQPHQLYLWCRVMLATQALIYYQVLLPVKKMVGYLKEIIDIADSDKEVQEIYDNLIGLPGEYKTDKTNFFSILFGFIFARQPFYAPCLSDLIDALDEFQPEIRTLLLVNFEEDSIESRILIDNVWRAEARLENPDWARCLQVYEKVIERALAWGYPYIAAASAKGIAIIHDEYLQDSTTAHKVIQDISSKLGPLPVIEEERALIYLRQKHYKEALNIYERMLPEWAPSSEKSDIVSVEEYRRAGACAAQLDNWEKAATFFENGAAIAQKVDGTEEYIGLYADAGFAQFKAGNMLNSIKLFNLALQKFETLPQDNTDVKCFTLKKRLSHTVGWMAGYERENYPSDFEEPPVGFCSDPETNEKFLNLHDSPMGYLWLHLAQIEYKFGHGMTALERAAQITDREADPILSFFLVLLETQYDFRNKTFDNLPQRIHQMTNACDIIRENNRSESMEETGENAIYPTSIPHVPNFASVEDITVMLVAALLVQLPTGANTHEILTTWRTNSSELPINGNMVIALNLIESTLSGDKNNALTAMITQEVRDEERLVAALKFVHTIETGPEILFYAHTFIMTALIDQIWRDPVMRDAAELFSAQWLEKIKFPATLRTPKITVPQIRQACNSNEIGKKKIGQILLAVRQAVSLKVPSHILQQFYSWVE